MSLRTSIDMRGRPGPRFLLFHRPIEFEALTMPSQNGGWHDHCQIVPPAVPEAGEQHPEDTVNGPKPGPSSSMNEARELMTQGDILGDKISAVLENGDDEGGNR